MSESEDEELEGRLAVGEGVLGRASEAGRCFGDTSNDLRWPSRALMVRGKLDCVS